jgi:hypothetical protein
MGRSTSRVRLENGLKLNINRLLRRGFIARGCSTGPVGISWTSDYWGELARGTIWADLSDQPFAWLRIQLGQQSQTITLASRPRHFGGTQWYFVCPSTGRLASVLWRPPGSNRFCSRQTWGRQVAYTSQCVGLTDRAWRGKAKIKARLIAKLDPDEWDLPPKPKGMRLKTYQRLEARFERYEEMLDRDLCLTVARLKRLKIFF